jgi:hypothetical protein
MTRSGWRSGKRITDRVVERMHEEIAEWRQERVPADQ